MSRFSLATLRQIYAGLAPRERQLVLGAAALTLLVIVGLAVQGVRSARRSLERRIESKQEQLEEIHQLRGRYHRLQRDADVLFVDDQARPADFSLFSFLESIGSRAMAREKITAMNPDSRSIDDEFREESVEMRLSSVSLPELVDLLYRVQTGPVPLRVSRLTMRKRFNDPYAFDVTMSVSMLLRQA